MIEPVPAAQSVADLLASTDRPTYSFEFYPPKDEAGRQSLMETIDLLEPLQPDWVSITYGANGGNRDRTLGLTVELAQRAEATQRSFLIVGHLTCTGQSRDELVAAIDAYGEAGVRNILAIRGDMPGGATVPWQQHESGLANATELVELIKSRGDFCVGVAAFPDVHPSSNPQLDVEILQAKQQAGAEFAVTQLFFDAAHYFRLVEAARAAGVTIPIIGGVMPVTNIKGLGKMAELSGADIPARVVETLLKVPDDPVMVRTAGSMIASQLCRELLDGGAPGLQFFTQNRSVATREILAMLRASGY